VSTPTLAVWKFASCDGCQLTLLDMEDELLALAGAVDVAAERRRLEKDLAAAISEAEQAERKLGNADFTAKAPAEVVAKTRQRLEAARSDVARLEQRLAALVG